MIEGKKNKAKRINTESSIAYSTNVIILLFMRLFSFGFYMKWMFDFRDRFQVVVLNHFMSFLLFSVLSPRKKIFDTNSFHLIPSSTFLFFSASNFYVIKTTLKFSWIFVYKWFRSNANQKTIKRATIKMFIYFSLHRSRLKIESIWMWRCFFRSFVWAFPFYCPSIPRISNDTIRTVGVGEIFCLCFF